MPATRSLFNRARNVTLQKENLWKEEHFIATFKQMVNPCLSFVPHRKHQHHQRSQESQHTRRKRQTSQGQLEGCFDQPSVSYSPKRMIPTSLLPRKSWRCDPLQGLCWGNAKTPRDASYRTQGCMQEGRYLKVCHHRASVGSATPNRLGCDKGAGQGHQAYPAEGKGALHCT